MNNKDRQAILDAAKKILRSKRCVYAGYGPCSGPIISAHTIPKCFGLKEVAEDGFVYSYDLKPYPSPGKRGIKKIGINQVSTFNLACEQHDNDLFKTIESGKLVINEDSVRLFFLRSMAQEIYEGENQIEFIKLLPIMQSQTIIDGVSAKEADNKHYFELAKSKIVKMKYCCLNYSQALPFLATTAHSPLLSIGGDVIFESSNTKEVAPVIIINAFNFEEKGKILFSWPEECDLASTTFLKDILFLPLVTDFILNFLFLNTQNLILKTSFYESLPDTEVEALINSHQFNLDPRHPFVEPTPDVHFGLSNFQSISTNVAGISLLDLSTHF